METEMTGNGENLEMTDAPEKVEAGRWVRLKKVSMYVRSLAVSDGATVPVVVEPGEVVDALAVGLEVVDALELAESTKRNHQRSWRAFCECCAAKGVDPLDAEWDQVLECLLSEKIGGVLAARKAIGYVYHARGMASPAADRRVGYALGTRQAAWQENVGEDRRKSMVRSQADYEGWCRRHGLNPAPASGAQVAAFLESLGDRASEEVVRAANVAVSFYQMERGFRATEDHPVVWEMFRERRTRKAAGGEVIGFRNERPGGGVARHRCHWEQWRDDQGIERGTATAGDVVRYFRGVEHQKVAGQRLHHLRKSCPEEGALWSDEVSQWFAEFRSRLADGEVPGVVLRNRTRAVLEEWEADAEALASGPVRVPKGLTLEEVTRRRRSDAAPRLSSNTLEGYALAWAEFTDWLQEKQIALGEVEDVTVRVFLEAKAESNRVNTLRTKLSGVAYGFGRKGFVATENPGVGDDPAFFLEDLKLERKEGASQMDPIREAEFRAIEETAMVPRLGERESAAEIRGARTITLVRMMFDGVSRGVDMRRAKRTHVSRSKDGSGVLRLPYSKTDRYGRGEVAYVSPLALHYFDLMCDLMRFYGIDERADGRIFWSNRSVLEKTIKQAAADAGLEGRYGGHSMRIGGAQELCMAGFSLPMIMLAGRWSDVQTVKLYVRNIAVQDSAMAKLQRMLLNGEHRLGPEARGADVMSCYNAVRFTVA